MKRRLRKKLHLDEFAVMGFEFTASLAAIEDDKFDGFFDALIEFIESRNLLIMGGGASDKFCCYATSMSRYGSATDEDRNALEAWLKGQSGISDITVSPLTDAFYS